MLAVHRRAPVRRGVTSQARQTPRRTCLMATTQPMFAYEQIELDTKPGIALFDITPQIKEVIKKHGVAEGTVHVISRHTTTALVINECEPRLLDDIRQVSALHNAVTIAAPS